MGRRVALLVVAVASMVAGCGGDEFEDRTAVVELGGSTETYQVDSCGLDGQTLYLVARADGGAVLQAVVGLADDDTTGVPDSTGMSIDADPTATGTRVAAFGAESWARQGKAGNPPGTVTKAQLKGSRIQLAGLAVPVDGDDRPRPDAEGTPFSIDARCDERDD